MTNLQEGASRLSGATLRRLWLLLPAAAIGGVGVLVILAGLLPFWASLQQDSQRLQELEQRRDQVTSLRGQLASTRENTEKAIASKAKIIKLITGNGDLSTFLAVLDREAREAGVKLTLYEPIGGAPAAPNQAGGAAPPAQPQAAPPPGAPPQGAQPPPADGGSLAQEGLTERTLLVSARGPFQSLLSFLRRLEALNVLVVQSDLNLRLSDASGPNGKPLEADLPVVMNLSLGLYSRQKGGPTAPAPGAAAPGAAAPPAAPPAVPPAAPPAAPPPAAPPAAPPPAAPPAAAPTAPAP
jgi:type IV pilus assembly protein PilO